MKRCFIGFIVLFLVCSCINGQKKVERIILEESAILAEMDKLLSDENSPPTFVLANDIDDSDLNGDEGVIFTTVIPEDIKDYPPDEIFFVKKESGEWRLSGETYEDVMDDVIGGLSGILVFHINELCYIMLWE